MHRPEGHGAFRSAPVLLLLLVLLLPGEALLGQTPREGLIPGTIGAYVASIFSGGPSSTEGAPTLLLPIGARSVGLGKAVSASEGSESAFWNPAGLAGIGEGRFVVLRGAPLDSESTAFSLILAKQPLGVIALSYELVDFGGQDLTDRDNNVIGTVSFRDHLGIFSFATPIVPGLDGGVNFKVFQSRITCRGQCNYGGVTGTVYALDFGVQSAPIGKLPLRLGAMIAHAGPSLQLINAEQADPLPTRIRVAGTYEVLHHFTDRPGMEIWVLAELEDHLRELGSTVLYVGGEFLAGDVDQVFVRAGYGQGQLGQLAGASVGIGLKYQQFEIGIAKSLNGGGVSSESEPAHVTFGVLF